MMKDKGKAPRRKRADSTSGWLHPSSVLSPGASRRQVLASSPPEDPPRDTSPSPPPQPPSPQRASPPVPLYSPPVASPAPAIPAPPIPANTYVPFPPRDVGVAGLLARDSDILLRLEEERGLRTAAERSLRNFADKFHTQEMELKRLRDQLGLAGQPTAVGELQVNLTVSEEGRRRANAEILSARTEAEHTRQLREEAEVRCRILETELRDVGMSAEDEKIQLRRHGAILEQEVSSLRARNDALTDELTALQACNKEWLRQFRRQRSELAAKTLECDWLRSIDTSESTLDDMGITKDDAKAVIKRLEETSYRQRQGLRTLGSELPPPPASSPRRLVR